MPEALCPFCNSDSARLFRTRDRNRRLSKKRFEYLRCTACSLIFLANPPVNMGKFYPSDYYALPASLLQARTAAAPEKFKLDIVSDFVSRGRLLEIGPAYGGFCLHAKDAGFEVDALEMDEGCCKFLSEVIGVNAINRGDVPAALRDLQSYDVIALWHVIEHLDNAWEVIRAIASRLNPGGIVVLATPNPEAFQFKVFRRYWTHVDAPRHQFLIPARWLIDLGDAVKLNPVLLTTSDTGSKGWDIFGWQCSIANFFFAPKTLKYAVCRASVVVARLMKPFDRRALKGSAYTLVLQKSTVG